MGKTPSPNTATVNPKNHKSTIINQKAKHKTLESHGRVPPQATEVEQAVLGAALIENQAAEILVGRARESWFYKTSHRMVFAAIKTLKANDKPLDLLSVENKLKDREQIEQVGGATYLSDLTRSTSGGANIEYHLDIIEEKYLLREAIILKFNDYIKRAYGTDPNPFTIIEEASTHLDEIMIKGTHDEGISLQDGLQQTLEDVEQAYINYQNGITFTGIPTGLGIDEMTSGYQNGDLIIVAGRPSMGKTAFVINNAHYAALHKDNNYRKGVGIFSLEMSRKSLITRFLTLESGIDQEFIRGGKINESELKTLVSKTAGRLAKANIHIDDTPTIPLPLLRTRARKWVKKEGVGMIIVDYLQLMGVSDDRNSNREQDISQISRGLKAIAKELHVPVIALSQLSRAVEIRGGNKRPIMADLRESGAIEQDADLIIFLWRPEYYDITEYAGQSTKNVAYAIIGKQRNGPVGDSKMYFKKETGRFSKPDTIYEKAANGQPYNLNQDPKF